MDHSISNLQHQYDVTYHSQVTHNFRAEKRDPTSVDFEASLEPPTNSFVTCITIPKFCISDAACSNQSKKVRSHSEDNRNGHVSQCWKIRSDDRSAQSTLTLERSDSCSHCSSITPSSGLSLNTCVQNITTQIPSSSSPIIPPPMMEIDVDRLKCPNAFITERVISGCIAAGDNEFILPHETTLNETKSAVSQSSDGGGIRSLICTLKSSMDYSVRDSGLSSQSSSSTSNHHPYDYICSDIECDNNPPAPPPIPRHAPKSLPQNARGQQCYPETKHVDRCSKSFDGNGLSDLLHDKQKSDPDYVGATYLPASAVRNSESPVWKRKPSSASNMYPISQNQASKSAQYSPVRTINSGPSNDLIHDYVRTKQRCPRCDLAQHYLMCSELSHARPSDLSSCMTCETCQSLVWNVGVNLFNRNPLRSMKFLQQHQLLDLSHPSSVAEFLLSGAHLSRSRIGSFVGLPPSERVDPRAVFDCLLQTLNFRNTQPDEAIRLVIHHFGIPVESQEIHRYLECLTSHYLQSHWPSMDAQKPDFDQILLLFYSILLLQTNLHNKTAAKSIGTKQAFDLFMRTTHRFLSQPEDWIHSHDQCQNKRTVCPIHNDFSVEKRLAMCHRIKSKPLNPGSDHTELLCEFTQSLRLDAKRYQSCMLSRKHPREVDAHLHIFRPHRRLVAYCVLLQCASQQPMGPKTYLLRHVFLLNDLMIIARSTYKDISSVPPSCPSHNPHNTCGDTRTLSFCIPHPCVRASGDNSTQRRSHLRIVGLHQLRVLLRRICRPKEKLAIVHSIPLMNCVIKPFNSSACALGLEIWKFGSGYTSPPSTKHNTVDKIFPKPAPDWNLLVTLGALNHCDHHLFLQDLISCLREVYWVNQEWCRFSSSSSSD